MASHAKGKVSSAELRQRYRLPIFCCSAVDFQKLSGARLYDGAPNVWDDAEDTQIPSLQRFFHECVLKKRFDRAHASMTALVNFCDNIERSVSVFVSVAVVVQVLSVCAFLPSNSLRTGVCLTEDIFIPVWPVMPTDQTFSLFYFSFLAPEMHVENGVVDKAAIRACARQSFDKLELQLNAAIEKQCQELSGKMEVNHCIKYTVI